MLPPVCKLRATDKNVHIHLRRSCLVTQEVRLGGMLEVSETKNIVRCMMSGPCSCLQGYALDNRAERLIKFKQTSRCNRTRFANRIGWDYINYYFFNVTDWRSVKFVL